MSWRERIRRATEPIVRSVARAVRGDSDAQSMSEASVAGATAISPPASPVEPQLPRQADTEQSAVPPWGLLPSQVPPRVGLLRGRASIEILRRSWRPAVQLTVVVAIYGTFILLDRREDIPLVWIVPITLLVAGTQFAAIGYRARKRARAEHRAGYTVWRRRALQLPQADALTGFVIRPAGAPMLSKQQEAVELRRVREIGRFVARHPRTMGGQS
jgi:hypothetical protein